MIGLSSILVFAVPFAIAAMLPGPAQAALVARVLARGGQEAIPFVLGMVAGNAAWLCIAAWGLTALASAWAPLLFAIRWGGAFYLAFLAWRFWNAPAQPAAADSRPGAAPGALGGLALTLGNPKAVVFFGAVLPQAIDLTRLPGPDFLVLLATGMGIDLLVQAGYVLFAGRARALIRSAGRMRVANRSAAAVMAGSAALVAAR